MKVFDTCILLIALALTFLLFGIVCYKSKPVVYDAFSSRDMYVELPKNWREEPDVKIVEPEVFETFRDFRRRIASMPRYVTLKRIVLNDSYRCFITAYCAEECGWSYSTSSGETCHRSSEDNRYEPTTCAIDLRYFRYGTMFYVPSEDRVYIAEDTGPGVQGLWIDTYQDDMSDVYGYNTRYETVYICDFEDYEETMRIPNIREYMKIYMQEYLGFPTNR